MKQNLSKPETSKIILFRTFWIFWALVALVIVMIAMFPAVGDYMIDVLQTAATLAGAVHVGYFGKAGVENFKKIESAMKNSVDDDVYDDEDCEG